MNIITLDFETYFDESYTLKKMTTESYIRDPRFEALGCGVREIMPAEFRNEQNNPQYVMTYIEPDQLKKEFARIDWPQTAVLAHHAHFDGLILSHHYGIKPAFWLDTLSMGRLVHGNSIGLSLESLAKHYDLSPKSVPYNLFQGRRWKDLSPSVRQELGDGCIHDIELTWEIFRRLSDGFPQEELKVIDQTIRFFTEPALEGDQALLEKLRLDEWTSKNTRMINLGVTEKQLQSPAQFVELLQAEDVEVEYKQGKNGLIPAIAATDSFMRELETHDNGRVADLARARLEVRSTIDETRSARLGAMSGRGPLCVYLSYCGAQTLRWSGGDKVNFQNFRRGGDIRKALCAPAGYAVGVVDLSQIEARVLLWLAGQEDALDKFRNHEDLYSQIAEQFYGYPVSKATPAERGVGKQMILSCGYGSGAATFRSTAARGTYGPRLDIDLDDADRAVKTYRSTYKKIPQYWKECDEILRKLADSYNSAAFNWGPMSVHAGRIIMPNGAWMNYELEWSNEHRSMQRKTRNGWRKIWGGVVAQNVCEALSRLILSQAMLRCKAQGIKFVLCTHDEVVFVEKTQYVEDAFKFVSEELVREVSWMPGLPLECEGGFGERYSK